LWIVPFNGFHHAGGGEVDRTRKEELSRGLEAAGGQVSQRPVPQVSVGEPSGLEGAGGRVSQRPGPQLDIGETPR
jgi:hypothetical protein